MTGPFSSQTAFDRWEATHKAGRRAFIIKHGILGWGIPVAIALTLWDWYSGIPADQHGFRLALGIVLFGLVGGTAFGAAMWRIQGWIYSKAQQ